MVAAFEPQAFSTLDLEHAVALAHARASEANHRVFLRVHKLLNIKSIWPLQEQFSTPGELLIAWDDDREGRALLACGIAAEIPISGLIRFGQAQASCLELREQTIDLPLGEEDTIDSTLPLALGGFAFSPRDRVPDRVWDGWDDGMFWVPRWLVNQDEKGCRMSVTEVVEPGQTRDEVRHRLGRSITQLEERLSARVGNDGGWRPAGAVRLSNPTRESSVSKEGWCQKVDEARRLILDGELEKVVLARSERFEAPRGQTFDPLATVQALRRQYRDCKVFVIRRPDGSAFVGATPELFCRLHDGKVETVALAGTIRRGSDSAEDEQLGEELLASAKDLHEHQLVTRAIRESLNPLTTDLQVGEEPSLLRLSNVQHLETKISATLDRKRTVVEILAHLHPTPAVGGAPVGAALQWMRDNEQLDRGWYAGLVGWVTADGEGLFAVAIRSALLRGNQAWAFAGAGLVADSDPELEWDETALKLEAMRHGLVTQ